MQFESSQILFPLYCYLFSSFLKYLLETCGGEGGVGCDFLMFVLELVKDDTPIGKIPSFKVHSQPRPLATESASWLVDVFPPLLLQIQAYLRLWTSVCADHLQCCGWNLELITALSLAPACTFPLTGVCCTLEGARGSSPTALLLLHWSNFSHCLKLLQERHLGFCL